jgi:hypothetical protein
MCIWLSNFFKFTGSNWLYHFIIIIFVCVCCSRRSLKYLVTIYVSGLRVLELSHLSGCECEASRARWGRCSLQFSVQTVHHKEEVDLKHCNTEHLKLQSAETFGHIMQVLVHQSHWHTSKYCETLIFYFNVCFRDFGPVYVWSIRLNNHFSRRLLSSGKWHRVVW